MHAEQSATEPTKHSEPAPVNVTYDVRAICREEFAKALDAKYSHESFAEMWGHCIEETVDEHHHTKVVPLSENEYRRFCQGLAQRKLAFDLKAASTAASERATQLRDGLFVELRLAHEALKDANGMRVHMASGTLEACECKEPDEKDKAAVDLLSALLTAIDEQKAKSQA